LQKIFLNDLILFILYNKTDNLVFKGGTALYKLYGLPRFSEDLDFTVIRNVNIKKIIELLDSLKFWGLNFSYDIKESISSVKITLRFHNFILEGVSIKIELDLSRREGSYYLI